MFRVKKEKKYEWENRRSPLHVNRDRKWTTWPTNLVEPGQIEGSYVGHGKIYKIGNTTVNKNTTKVELMQLLENLGYDGYIYEEFDTEFCQGTTRDGGTMCCSTIFRRDPVSATRICYVCSVSSRQVQYNMTNSMGENGKANNTKSNCADQGYRSGAVATSHGDSAMLQEKKRRSTQKIEQIIRTITTSFQPKWQNMEYIAIDKLHAIYSNIHGVQDQQVDNNKRSMPKGQASLAAACLFGSILEKSHSHNGPSLLHIIDQANKTNKSQDKDTIDAAKVIGHLHTLSYHGLLDKNLIPALNAPSTLYKSDTSRIQTLKTTFIKNKKIPEQPIMFLQKMDLGLKVERTKHGVLQIISVNSEAIDFKLKLGDFIMNFQNAEIPVDELPNDFYNRMQCAMNDSKSNLSFVVRRKERQQKGYRQPRSKYSKSSSSSSSSSSKRKRVNEHSNGPSKKARNIQKSTNK